MNKNQNTNGAAFAPLGLYVHIPFCVRKCKYCDFFSCAGVSDLEKTAYVDRLCEEIRAKGKVYKDAYYVDTVFFGGGTPTILEARDLAKILKCIDESFVLGCVNARECKAGLSKCDGLEISFEANPGTVSRDKLADLRLSGFNRISIGVQSFDDDILKTLGRIHSAGEAEEAVLLAKDLGYNTNIDLMFGVPGLSLATWEESLRKALALGPDHISFYSLQLEEETPLYESYRFGDLKLPPWEENRAMYHMALDILKEKGFTHYEISNASRPGFECRHNLKYWNMQDYLGFGPAAHSYIAGKRFYNTQDIYSWEGVDDPDIDRKGDYIFTRLRLISGFPGEEYKNIFGTDFSSEFAGCYDPDLLTEEDGYIKLTKRGLDFTNPVMERLINSIKR